MAQTSQKGSIKGKLLLINVVLLAAIVSVALANFVLDRMVAKGVTHPEYMAQIMTAQKVTLKTLVDVEAANLAEKLKTAKTRDEQIKIIISETDPIRFFDDKTGYFFTYDLNGIRVNVPIDKSQNGMNLIDLKDPKGNPLIKNIVDTAKNGSGFVEYYFMKPNRVIAPKTSYVTRIPGTDFLIGSGTYVDLDLEADNFQGKIDTKMQTYSTYRIASILGILALAMVLSVWSSNSIARQY